MPHYARRRSDLAAALDGGVAIVPSGRETIRNGDNVYVFRQNSDFFYLTGFEEPDAVLVLRGGADARSTLFVRPRDASAELWTGRRAGVEGAVADYGADAAFPTAELAARLPALLADCETVHYDQGIDEAFDRTVMAAVHAARAAVRRGGTAPRRFAAPGIVLHEMRLRKSEEELALMRRAAEATHAGFLAGMQSTRHGMREYELQAEIEYRYRCAGARETAYPSIVARGANACTLHYHTNRDVLRDGDLVLVDSGAEFENYACDVTRTWPVNGRFTGEQRALYEVVLRAQAAAFAKLRTSERLDAYHLAATRVIAEGLIDLGLITESVDTAIEGGKIRTFYPHGTGHFLGLDVHDVGAYREAGGASRPVVPGMVLTVEPGIYVQPGSESDVRFAGIGIRVEDDVLCTEGDPVILTHAIPKDPNDLEAIVGSMSAGAR